MSGQATIGTFHRLLGWAWKCGAAVLVLVLLALLNNNYSLRHPPRAELRARLDGAIEASTNWLAAHPQVMGNPALMFMVADMEAMSGDPRLRQLLDKYRHSRFVTDSGGPFGPVWLRMVDPRATVPPLDGTGEPDNDIMETLWDAYAVAPDRVLISGSQRANMFSPTKYSWGRRQHQLLALDMYRHYNGGYAELDTTLSHLAELVARDGHYDVRVNDSYPQRIAFVLAAQRPDFIRSRWIDRLLDYQHPDGTWSYCWYGWCKGIFEFSRRDLDPLHATTQAMWVLYMLKYRYAQWIDRHYR